MFARRKPTFDRLQAAECRSRIERLMRSARIANDLRVCVPRRHDAALRLWIEHEPRPDGRALPDARARSGPRRSRAGGSSSGRRRLWLDRAAAGRDRARRAVAGRAARPRGAQRLREHRYRSLSSPHLSGPLPAAPAAGAGLHRAPPGHGQPRPGYIIVVVEAARDWGLPEPTSRRSRRWSPSALARHARKDTGEIAMSAARHPPRRRSAAACRASAIAPGREHTALGAASKAGCATAATARSRRCSPGPRARSRP